MEGLLLALAQSGEEDLDGGRWRKRVSTSQGEVEFVLSLPSLLEAMAGKKPKEARPEPGPELFRSMERMMGQMHRIAEQEGLESPEEANRFFEQHPLESLPPVEPRTPREEAQELVYQAFEARGRRRLQLARQALKISPDCTDAYVILGERAGDPAKALELYRQGMAAGERVLGPDVFKQAEGEFWGLLETRPYMRARRGVAMSLELLGRDAEAAEHYQAMLRLNPQDNQGMRHLLAPLLYRLGRDERLQKLLEQFGPHDPSLMYLQALLTFKREGDSPRARAQAAKALTANRHFKKYLLGEAEVPPWQPPFYESGSEEEAVAYADDQVYLWADTPGAIRWLKLQKPPGAAGKAKKRKR